MYWNQLTKQVDPADVKKLGVTTLDGMVVLAGKRTANTQSYYALNQKRVNNVSTEGASVETQF